MALIKCIECGKEISDKATACPNCGCPVSSVKEEKTIPVQSKQKEHHKHRPRKAKVLLIVAVALVAVLVAVIVSSAFSRYNWNDVKLRTLLPEPESKWGDLSTNRDDYLSLYVHRLSPEDFNTYISACVDKGFSVDAVKEDKSYDAFNIDGYKLELYYRESDKEMRICVDAPMEMGVIQWPDSKIAKLLPIPDSTEGLIERDDEKGFEIYLKNVSKADLESYLSECKADGFTLNYDKQDNYYYAQNAEGYQLTAEYKGCNVVYISVIEPQRTLELQFVSTNSKCDVEVRVDDSYECTVDHGESETRTVKLGLGKHIIRVENDDNDEVYAYYEIDVTKDEHIKFEVKCTKDNIQINLYGQLEEEQESVDVKPETDKKEETQGTNKTVTSKKVKSITEEILEEDLGNSVKITKLYFNEELQGCYVEFEAKNAKDAAAVHFDTGKIDYKSEFNYYSERAKKLRAETPIDEQALHECNQKILNSSYAEWNFAITVMENNGETTKNGWEKIK